MDGIIGFSHNTDFIFLDILGILDIILSLGFRVFVAVMLYKIYKKLK